MRIGIDVRIADPAESGQQRYLWRLGEWAAARGHEVHFLTVRPQRPEATAPHGARLHRLHDASAARLRRSVADLDLDVLLLNPERSRRYRGIEANVLRAAYGTEQYRQKLRSFRGPGVRTLRRLSRLGPWTRLEMDWERAFYEAPSVPPYVIAQSGYMRAEILTSYELPPEQVRVVPNGVDLDELRPDARLALRPQARARWGIPEGALCFLLLGHNFRLKGFGPAIDAFARLDRRRPVHFLAAGRGTGRLQRWAAARRARSLGLEQRVTLAGPVRPSLFALAAADVLVHLSWHDSFGFAVLEAMATGLPVVTTPYTGAAEIVDPAHTALGASEGSVADPPKGGIVVDPDDLGAVVDALRQLTDDTARDLLGEAAAAIASDFGEARSFAGAMSVMELAATRGRDRGA